MGHTKTRGEILIRGGLFTLFTIAVFVFLFLSYGLHFSSLNILGINIDNFSLIWDKRLSLQVERITLPIQADQNSSKSSPTKILDTIHSFRKLFSSLKIHDLQYKSIHTRIQYNSEDDTAHIDLTANDIRLNSTALFSEDSLQITLHQFAYTPYGLTGTAQLTFLSARKQFSGSCSVTLADSLPVALNFSGDTKGLSFTGINSPSIDTIDRIVDLFAPDETVRPWITDYLTGTNFHLETLSGSIPWNNPAEIFRTLKAELTITDCQYTFAQGLEPIKTQSTKVEFADGILTILPQQGSFYGQDTKKSWLDINFNDVDNIILTTRIQTVAVANKDIGLILAHYDIPFPLEQTSGNTETDIVLAINFNSSAVDIVGDFNLQQSTIVHKNSAFFVNSASLHLHNSQLSLKESSITFEEMYTATAKGEYNGAENNGKFTINLDSFSHDFNSTILTLAPNLPSPEITYHITPEKNWIEATQSRWNFGGNSIDLAPFSAIITGDDLLLSKLQLKLDDILAADISGKVSFSPPGIELDATLTNFVVDKLQLEQPLPLTVRYDEKLRITSDNTSNWIVEKQPLTLSPTEIILEEGKLHFPQTAISVTNLLQTAVSGALTADLQGADLLIHSLTPDGKAFAGLLAMDETLPLHLEHSKNSTTITIPKYSLTGEIINDGKWILHSEKPYTFFHNLPALQEIIGQKGRLTLFSNNEEQIHIIAKVTGSEHLLFKNGLPVTKLEILIDKGIDGHVINVNNDIAFTIASEISITGDTVATNVPAIVRLINQITGNMGANDAADDEQKHPTQLSLSGNNIELYFDEETRVISDTLNGSYIDGKWRAQLHHGKGKATFTYENDQFYLEGQNLNNDFMEALSSRIQLTQGEMNIAAQGRLDEYSVLIGADDLVVRDFAPLNNILAFLDTIPALITFSWPEFSTQGFPITSAVAGVTAKNGLITIESLTMQSPVTNMTGTGWADRNTRQIDLDFNMFTKAKSNLNKIPLLGYILVGDEKHPSIHLKVSGDFSNPKVEHTAYREVLTLPYSIIKRAANLPQVLLDKME